MSAAPIAGKPVVVISALATWMNRPCPHKPPKPVDAGKPDDHDCGPFTRINDFHKPGGRL